MCRNLKEEAESAKNQLKEIHKSIPKEGNKGQINLDEIGSKLSKIAMNFNSKKNVFVKHFMDKGGIKEIMVLIERAIGIEESIIINFTSQMLVIIFGFSFGIEAIRTK